MSKAGWLSKRAEFNANRGWNIGDIHNGIMHKKLHHPCRKVLTDNIVGIQGMEDAGKSVEEIAEHFGVSRGTFYTWRQLLRLI